MTSSDGKSFVALSTNREALVKSRAAAAARAMSKHRAASPRLASAIPQLCLMLARSLRQRYVDLGIGRMTFLSSLRPIALTCRVQHDCFIRRSAMDSICASTQRTNLTFQCSRCVALTVNSKTEKASPLPC